MRFKVGEHARVLYIRGPLVSRDKECPEWCPGAEVEVMRIGPYPPGYITDVDGRKFHCGKGGSDYIVNIIGTNLYAAPIDAQLIKMTDPDGQTIQEKEEIEA